MKTVELSDGTAVLVDDEDFHVASQFSWHMTGVRTYNGYTWQYPGTNVRVDGKHKMLLLHRLLMGARFGDNRRLDHVNGNTRDAQKSNLRWCSHGQNISNQRNRTKTNKSSRFHGVYFDRWKQRWKAQIRCEKRKVCLGNFTDEVQAARAYDMAAMKLHGSFASLNNV